MTSPPSPPPPSHFTGQQVFLCDFQPCSLFSTLTCSCAQVSPWVPCPAHPSRPCRPAATSSSLPRLLHQQQQLLLLKLLLLRPPPPPPPLLLQSFLLIRLLRLLTPSTSSTPCTMISQLVPYHPICLKYPLPLFPPGCPLEHVSAAASTTPLLSLTQALSLRSQTPPAFLSPHLPASTPPATPLAPPSS